MLRGNDRRETLGVVLQRFVCSARRGGPLTSAQPFLRPSPPAAPARGGTCGL